MKPFRLYVITDESCHPDRGLLDVMELAIRGGADIVQLRDKTGSKRDILQKARALAELTRHYGVPLMINDHIDVALAVDADGVHLGQDDLPLSEARKIVGDKIIGISTHTIEQARKAEREGADYIGVGPVFPTRTKENAVPVTTRFVRQAAAEIRIPFVAIGGIGPDNVDEVLRAGARSICAVRAIVGSDDVRGTCEAFRRKIARYADAPSERRAAE